MTGKSFIILQQAEKCSGYVVEESSKNHRDFSVIFVPHPDLNTIPRMELRA